MAVLLVVFVTLVFVYSLVSARLARTVVTPPILFTTAGIALAFVQEPSVRGGNPEVLLLRVAEVGLVLLLFTDASRTDLRVLRSIQNLPIRLLSTGLLLTIVLGALVGLGVFRHLSIWEAGILGAILAPTDAGLGQIIVGSPRVPVRVRQALNVEAGLNDGLCVPFLMFFMAGDGARLAPFVAEQLVYGALVGGGIGLAGGWLLGRARQRAWMAESFQQLGVVALPAFCVLASEAVGASMFIAAFVAGLLVQVGFGEAGRHSVEFAEEWGQLLNLSVFFLFGMLVARAWPQFEPGFVIYAFLSLTLVRMVPVAIALAGSRLGNATVLFMGWFGPRGLASIVLGLVYLEEEVHSPGEPTIRLAVMATVLLSILAHGLSARPGIDWYAARLVALAPAAPEAPSSPT
ncbi:MAG: cation:proton antiporter [Candidatus Binatia bacterium]